MFSLGTCSVCNLYICITVHCNTLHTRTYVLNKNAGTDHVDRLHRPPHTLQKATEQYPPNSKLGPIPSFDHHNDAGTRPGIAGMAQKAEADDPPLSEENVTFVELLPR